MNPKYEKSLIIIKPDAVQRNLIGEIIRRLERKGLKIIGLKNLSANGNVKMKACLSFQTKCIL